jgi:ADP-heptose:LPS heptosyltransferase
VVHPASGTPLRQWAPESFARLIDLLAEKDGVPTALIGGPDERGIADAVLNAVRRRDMVVDLVGRSRLAEVPRIMAGAALFIGNNSGPSHIAAGLGVPTIAVHSGVIASEEWGPLGPDAMALRREMSCGPCYIVNVSQCHRSMACLTLISPFAVHDACRRMLALGERDGLRVAEHPAENDDGR